MYNKIKFIFKYIPYVFHIIYFNFKYLPVRQAGMLPIFLYKPKLLKLKGRIIINSEFIKPGMIKLGGYGVSLFPNSGIVWENHGGTVYFDGNCSIGNASAISVGEKGNIFFGNNFNATAAFKITSYKKISFGKNVLIGWDNLFMDTDFHQIKSLDGKAKKGFGEISIGNNNWFGIGSVILKNTTTHKNTIVSGKSLLNNHYDFPEFSIIGGIPAKLITTGFYRDPDDDIISYY
jgi:acetyltransferase-like isoleucine patch superfamily enzyme